MLFWFRDLFLHLNCRPKVVSLNRWALYLAISVLLTGRCLANETDPTLNLDQLWQDTLFQIVSYVDVFHEKSATELWNDRYVVGTKVRLENHNYLNDQWSLNSVLRVAAERPDNRNGSFPLPGESNPDSPYIDFQTLNLLWEGENTDVLLGKDVLRLGFSALYNPVNRFGSRDWTRPEHAEPSGDLQMGIRYYTGEDVFRISLFPTGLQHFFTDTKDGSSAYPEQYKDPAVLIIYDAVRRGYDFYLGVHHGPGAYPIVESVSKWEPKSHLPTATTLLGGTVIPHNSWIYYADLLYQHTEDWRDDRFVRIAAGFSYSYNFDDEVLIDGVTPKLTYTKDKTLKHANANTSASSWGIRGNENNLLGSLDFRINDDISVSVGGNYSFSEKTIHTALGGVLRLNDSLTAVITNTFEADPSVEHSSEGYTSLSLIARF